MKIAIKQIVVLNFNTGNVHLIKCHDTDDVEEILTEKHGFDLSSIEWMSYRNIKGLEQ